MATPGGNNTANRGGPLVWEVDRSANRRVFAQYLVTNKDRKIDVAYLLRNAPTFKGLGTYGQQLFYLLMGACNIVSNFRSATKERKLTFVYRISSKLTP